MTPGREVLNDDALDTYIYIYVYRVGRVDDGKKLSLSLQFLARRLNTAGPCN